MASSVAATGYSGYEPQLKKRKMLPQDDDRAEQYLIPTYRQLKERIRVFLTNVFALRFLWLLCFGEAVPMRWVSWDQKPFWFNSTASDNTYSSKGHTPLIKEVEAQSRQRFTICTCVDSAAMSHNTEGYEPPPVGVLFKAAPNGKVQRELEADTDIPAWMHVTP